MANDSIKLFSSIKPALLRASLIRGTVIALCGVLLLAYGGTFLDVNTLSFWGIPLLLVGGGLIAFGLIPYRRLCRYEKNPNEIVVNQGGYMQFVERGKIKYSIPIESIDQLKYHEMGNDYGICVIFKKDVEKKMIVHNGRFDMGAYQKYCRSSYGCDLYIPYFARRAFTRLALYCT